MTGADLIPPHGLPLTDEQIEAVRKLAEQYTAWNNAFCDARARIFKSLRRVHGYDDLDMYKWMGSRDKTTEEWFLRAILSERGLSCRVAGVDDGHIREQAAKLGITL